MDILIKNVTAVTMDDSAPVIRDAFIGISGGVITYIGARQPQEPAARFIDGNGKIAMPGLVNAHTHVSMAVLRGYADDYALKEWLESHVWPAEAKMDAECVRVGAQLAMAEMLRTGTVAITDMYSKTPVVAQAAFEAGIYANIGNGAMCFKPEKYNFATDRVTGEMNEMLESWHGKDSGRIRLDAAIHAEYTSFDGLWRDVTGFARKHGLNMHVHLSETLSEHSACIQKYGKTPARVLAEAGVFDVPATAAHCVAVDADDIALLAEKHVTVAHNPISNLKLASGIAPVGDMLAAGVNVALGTDSVCSNNSHDMFEEIKTASLLQKGASLDPTAVPAWEALKMATINGAASQGRQGQIGMLRQGMDATLILVDALGPHMIPVHNPVSALAYSARGSDVCLTMVRGRALYENGSFATIDTDDVRRRLCDYVMPTVFGA